MGTYLPSTSAERAAMLADIGASSIDDLYVDVPGAASGTSLGMPEGLSEAQLRQRFEELACRNTVFSSIFRGAGAYARFRPAIVESVMANEIFTTAYTPYQAETSQGVLQSIFEYQSMNCELCGMDVACASAYDGATAAAEAVLMCQARRRARVVISAGVAPQTRKVIATYCQAKNIELSEVALVGGRTDADVFRAALGDDVFCTLVQQPNYYGTLEDTAALIEASHACGASSIVSAEPVSLGILASPDELGADICVCEGQSLGLPLSFGGPYLGMISCKQALMRKLPGRIVGQTEDGEGNRAFVLTLQAREQHIRREKASSNICSNQALCALGAACYLAALGPEGLARAARLSYSKAHYLAERLTCVDGFSLVYESDFFNEFVTTCPTEAKTLEDYLCARGILCGLPIEEGILWCATELNTKEQIDDLALCLADFVREYAQDACDGQGMQDSCGGKETKKMQDAFGLHDRQEAHSVQDAQEVR